jgi:hypothetical protein
MFLTVDVLEVDVLFIDVLELDVLGARRNIPSKCFFQQVHRCSRIVETPK